MPSRSPRGRSNCPPSLKATARQSSLFKWLAEPKPDWAGEEPESLSLQGSLASDERAAAPCNGLPSRSPRGRSNCPPSLKATARQSSLFKWLAEPKPDWAGEEPESLSLQGSLASDERAAAPCNGSPSRSPRGRSNCPPSLKATARQSSLFKWLAEPKPERAKAGGRGRNRTFNLSVKSRMLCQLSYASLGFKKAAPLTTSRDSMRSRKSLPHLEKYTTDSALAQARRSHFRSSSSSPRECATLSTAVLSQPSALQPSNQWPSPSSGK